MDLLEKETEDFSEKESKGMTDSTKVVMDILEEISSDGECRINGKQKRERTKDTMAYIMLLNTTRLSLVVRR